MSIKQIEMYYNTNYNFYFHSARLRGGPRGSLLKGVFAKNERRYKLTAKNKRFWSLLLFVASIRKKLLKMTYTEEPCVQCPYKFRKLEHSTRIVKKLILFQTNHSDITSDQKRLFFAVRLYPHSFFANTPFECTFTIKSIHYTIIS